MKVESVDDFVREVSKRLSAPPRFVHEPRLEPDRVAFFSEIASDTIFCGTDVFAAIEARKERLAC